MLEVVYARLSASRDLDPFIYLALSQPYSTTMDPLTSILPHFRGEWISPVTFIADV